MTRENPYEKRHLGLKGLRAHSTIQIEIKVRGFLPRCHRSQVSRIGILRDSFEDLDNIQSSLKGIVA